MNKDYEALKKELEEDMETSLNKFLMGVGLRATLKIKLSDVNSRAENYSIKDVYKVIDDLCLTETGRSIKEKTRKKEVVAYRQSYCKLAKDAGGYSLSTIGSKVSLDHATVIYSSNKVGTLLSTNDELMTRIYNLCTTTLTKKYIEDNESCVEHNNSEQPNT